MSNSDYEPYSSQGRSSTQDPGSRGKADYISGGQKMVVVTDGNMPVHVGTDSIVIVNPLDIEGKPRYTPEQVIKMIEAARRS